MRGGEGSDGAGSVSNCAGGVLSIGTMIYDQDVGKLELLEDNTKEKEQEQKILIHDHWKAGREREEEKGKQQH